MPYISASIFMQLMTVLVPRFQKMQKEGESGRKKINQYTRYLTVGLAIFQSASIAIYLESQPATAAGSIVLFTGMFFRLLTIFSLTAGTIFVMWLGEQISERGIRNGISLIIFAGIVSAMPQAVASTAELVRQNELSPFLLIALFGMMVGVIAMIIFVERGQRRIPVQSAKRAVGRRM